MPTGQLDLVVVQELTQQVSEFPNRSPQASRLVRVTQGHSPRILTTDLFAAADPRISFDGTRILFAGKKSAAISWQIWEMDVNGSNARQITHCPADCMKPAYLARGEIVFTAFASGAGHAASQLWVSKLDGSDAHPITFGPGDFQVETVLKNGSILATARSPLLPATGRPSDRHLYTLRPDGTGLATLRCDHEHPAIRSQAEELADGSVVFVKRPLEGKSVTGALAWIRSGALHNTLLTPPGSTALSPRPLSAESLVVARTISAGSPATSKLALYSFDTAQGKFGKLIYQDATLPSLAAVPVAAHEPPRWYWSTLNPQLQMGYFICIDSYLAQGVPHGRLAATLAHLRVLMLDPETQRETDLGEAAVEGDGSFYIAVPPDKPVRFELLDDRGQVIRAQRSWIWSRPGEERGCVGCHEDRALAPENRWPMALRRLEGPARLGFEKAERSKQQAGGSR